MLHRVILTAASVVALATAANAADMYRPSAGGYKDVPYVGVNWSGLYVGVNGGYGFNSGNIGGTIGAPYDISPEGAFGGGQIGFNMQRGNIVFGIEADIQGGNIEDSKTVSVTSGGTIGFAQNQLLASTISAPFAPVRVTRLIVPLSTQRAVSPTARSRMGLTLALCRRWRRKRFRFWESQDQCNGLCCWRRHRAQIRSELVGQG